MQKIVYLEVDEEITSVVDRLKNIKEERVVLVIPKRANLLQSIVNLKLLKNQIEHLNKEVIIVTTDKLGRNLASQVGFIVQQKIDEKGLEVEPKPTFTKPVETKITYRRSEEIPKEKPQFKIGPSITDITYRKEKPSFTPPFKKEEAPKPAFKAPPVKEKPKIIVKKRKLTKFALPAINKTVFLIGGIILIMVAFVLLAILPRASIKLILKGEPIDKSFEIIVEKDIENANFEKGIIKGTLITLEKTEEKKNLTCTGKKNIGQKATGTVTLSNVYDENPQSLVAGTRLVSTVNGQTYRINSAVTIPGARVVAGNIVPGTVNIEITADQPGQEYNLPSGSHFTIPGLAGTDKYDKIYADTTSAIRGGFTEEVTILSQEDFNKYKDQMVAELGKKARDELVSQHKDKELFLEGLSPQVLEATPNIPVGTESAKFDLKVKIKLVTLGASKKDFDYLVFKKLTASLPPDKDLMSEDIKVLAVKVISFEQEKKLVASIKASGYSFDKIDEDQIKKVIVGEGKEQATNYLTSLKGVSQAEVNLWPFWVRSVPRLFKKSIKINIEIKK